MLFARRLTRRNALILGTRLGLSAPAIAALLAACGGDDDDDDGDDESPTATEEVAATATQATGGAEAPTEEPDAEPTEAATATSSDTESGGSGRGQGDQLRILYWQAATILNPHLATGDKDTHPARICLEPLLDNDPEGNHVPILAADVPSIENGLLAEDGMSVTYNLKEGVLWSDGAPLTADDVKFTWEYVIDPATSSTTIATYDVITSIDVIDPLTVRFNFDQPNPAWFSPFSGTGAILPKHLLEEYKGERASDAPFNLMPIGTGPYKVASFNPGDVIIFELNENYREEDKPYFQSIEFKGGGDALSAGQAVLNTDEADYAWNLQVEKELLEQLEDSEYGTLDILPWISVEMLFINFADPNTEVDGARSEPSTTHPYFSDLQVRQAFASATDRNTIAEDLYGPAGQATTNFLVQPLRFASPNTSGEFDTERAIADLEEAGWVVEGGVRSKDGVEMNVLYQTTTNPVRNRTQEVIKQAWEEIGVSVELKSIDASVYFATDAGNPDTYGHFYADVQMSATGSTSSYPIAHMARFRSAEPEIDLAQQSNDWAARNINRWVNEEFNELYQAAETELDPDRQAELFIAMNDLAVSEVVVIPLVHRALVAGISNKLRGITRSALATDTWDIANWYFEE